jgi:DNA-directed RNA polymerase specialized sigma24 family protein
MESLYLLSFLLTGNHDKAEQCFLESLDECLNGISVFHDWADFWARRVIVRQALRMTAQHTGSLRPASGGVDSADEGIFSEPSLQYAAFGRVLALEGFERSVFVLSSLEGYSTQSCALLLAISTKEVLEARVRALQHMTDFDMERAVLAGDPALHA